MSDEQVVSNAGPLMVLAKLHLLHLLHALYGRVHVPSSVYHETVTVGLQQGHADAQTLQDFFQQMDWHPEAVPAHLISADLAAAALDRGERDTLALALALKDARVLIDESVARTVARALGLKVCGSLGILVGAYRHQMIDTAALRLYFSEIARRQDIWINPALAKRVLQQVLSE
jgi:predicted nucleic acid-binding protein